MDKSAIEFSYGLTGTFARYKDDLTGMNLVGNFSCYHSSKGKAYDLEWLGCVNLST